MTRDIMNVLGILFDRRLKWREQVSRAIKESNTNLLVKPKSEHLQSEV